MSSPTSGGEAPQVFPHTRWSVVLAATRKDSSESAAHWKSSAAHTGIRSTPMSGVAGNRRTTHWSGKGTALPPLPPLRTGRETFASSGSSRCEAPRERSRFHDGCRVAFMIQARSLLTCRSLLGQLSVPNKAICQRTHTWMNPRSFAFPLMEVLQVFS
jgi:hypothetical protein